jgi:hypothetical protein
MIDFLLGAVLAIPAFFIGRGVGIAKERGFFLRKRGWR